MSPGKHLKDFSSTGPSEKSYENGHVTHFVVIISYVTHFVVTIVNICHVTHILY